MLLSHFRCWNYLLKIWKFHAKEVCWKSVIEYWLKSNFDFDKCWILNSNVEFWKWLLCLLNLIVFNWKLDVKNTMLHVKCWTFERWILSLKKGQAFKHLFENKLNVECSTYVYDNCSSFILYSWTVCDSAQK